MPSFTDVANLALSHLGEPLVAAFETATGVTGQALRVHLPQAVALTLESHPFSFAAAFSRLSAAEIIETKAAAIIDPDPAIDDNALLLEAVTIGPAGNQISVELSVGTAADLVVTVSGAEIRVALPAVNSGSMIVAGAVGGFGNGTYAKGGVVSGRQSYFKDSNAIFWVNSGGGYWFFSPAGGGAVAMKSFSNVATPDLAENWIRADNSDPLSGFSVTADPVTATATQVIEALNDTPAAALLITAENAIGSDGSGPVAPVARTYLSGGSSDSVVFAPGWQRAYNLPPNCLRVVEIDGFDPDAKLNRFEIIGRHLLLPHPPPDESGPVVRFIRADPPPETWPADFSEAVALLLASRLASTTVDSPDLARHLLGLHEQALGRARSRDTRESRSKENHGPRQLAARSPLVASRFRSTPPLYP